MKFHLSVSCLISFSGGPSKLGLPIYSICSFVHSFICLTKNPNLTVAVCDYSGIKIPAVISVNNIFGCQFHPEKSAEDGLNVLKNFQYSNYFFIILPMRLIIRGSLSRYQFLQKQALHHLHQYSNSVLGAQGH